MSKEMKRYKGYLAKFPAPGGNGAHRAIYAAACLGWEAELSPETIEKDVRGAIPPGGREVTDQEIRDGVNQAYTDMIHKHAGGILENSEEIAAQIPPYLRDEFIKEGKGTTIEDFMRWSPVPVGTWPDDEISLRFIETLYAPTDLLFIADDKTPGRMDQSIRPVSDWIEIFMRAPSRLPKIIPNPLSGKWEPTKAGDHQTLRGDRCVSRFRFALGEFDNIPLEDQLAFWAKVPCLPVAALIMSGKKSIHAWIHVECDTMEEWDQKVRNVLFPGYLVPLGMDPACKNPARLSRMPGHIREDTGQLQRCIYLSPTGEFLRGERGNP